jgi:hypothetical protein
VHVHGASPVLLALFAVRARVSPPRRSAVAARAAAASKVALARNGRGNGLSRFRLEPRAPASPAQRRAATHRTRRRGQARGRPRGTPCPPDSRARARGLRRRCSCSPAPPMRVTSARRRVVPARAAAASKVVLARNRRAARVIPRAGARVRARRRAGPEVRAPGRLTQGHDDLSGYVVPHHSNHSGNLTLIPPPKKIASYPFLPCGEQGWWGNVDDVNIVLSVLVR